MKRWLMVSCTLLIVLTAALFFYHKKVEDRQGPEILLSRQLSYTEGMSEEELLSGVQAIDAQDGDVSDTLVVEKYTVNMEDGTVSVSYAARDTKNNVTKVNSVIPLAADFTYDSEAESEEETETEEPETAKETESEIIYESESEELEPGAPVILLTEVSARIPKGSVFDPLLYIASIEDDYDNSYDLWRDIQMEGEYDMDTPGTYELEFYVTDSSGNRSNRARFWLIVEDE